jgi:hypothetical protein
MQEKKYKLCLGMDDTQKSACADFSCCLNGCAFVTLALRNKRSATLALLACAGGEGGMTLTSFAITLRYEPVPCGKGSHPRLLRKQHKNA